jgi:hypothetical protein
MGNIRILNGDCGGSRCNFNDGLGIKHENRTTNTFSDFLVISPFTCISRLPIRGCAIRIKSFSITIYMTKPLLMALLKEAINNVNKLVM